MGDAMVEESRVEEAKESETEGGRSEADSETADRKHLLRQQRSKTAATGISGVSTD
jgi:hypothetical protein